MLATIGHANTMERKAIHEARKKAEAAAKNPSKNKGGNQHLAVIPHGLKPPKRRVEVQRQMITGAEYMRDMQAAGFNT